MCLVDDGSCLLTLLILEILCVHSLCTLSVCTRCVHSLCALCVCTVCVHCLCVLHLLVGVLCKDWILRAVRCYAEASDTGASISRSELFATSVLGIDLETLTVCVHLITVCVHCLCALSVCTVCVHCLSTADVHH